MKDVLTIEFTIHGVTHFTTRIVTESAHKSSSEKDSDYKSVEDEEEEDLADDMEDDQNYNDEIDDDQSSKIAFSPRSIPSGISSPAPEDASEEKAKKDKLEKRKLMNMKYIEDVRKQALEKILREQTKKPKKKEESQASTTIKKDVGPFIKYVATKDCKFTLSFPNGFVLPKILTTKETPVIKPIRICDICGKNAKYTMKNGKNSCSLTCYKQLPQEIAMQC